MSSITCPNTSCGATLEGADLRHCPRCGAFLPLQEQDATDPLIGQTIMNGKYRVVSVIGEGGMGKVYLAEQKFGTATRKVAIKTLQPELAGDSQIIARFYREAQTVIELEHPNTIKFYDFGEIDNSKVLFVVMEFIQGESLAHALSRGTMDPARTERILSQVCGSLQEAHERGIVHRDLKPDNIYLTQKGAKGDFVKVLDFGIAKRGEAVDEKEAKLTRQGMVLGTPPYMSPEQFTGQQLDNRSDIYALGIIAYEMLTGVLPFTAATPWEWATKHLTAQPTPIEAQPNGARLPERPRRAIMRALAKNRDERPRTVTEFLQDFAGHSEGATDWTASSTSMSNPSGQSVAPPGASSAQMGLAATAAHAAAYSQQPTPYSQPGVRPPTAAATPNPFNAAPPLSSQPGMMAPPPNAMGGPQPPYYGQQSAPGYVAAPSNAGFAAVPPGVPGSNPSYPGMGQPAPFGAPMTSAAGVQQPYPSLAQPAPKKSRTALVIGAIVAVLAIGAGVGINAYVNSGDDDDSPTAHANPPTAQPPSQPNGGQQLLLPQPTTTGAMVPGVGTNPSMPTQPVVQPIVQPMPANNPPQTNPAANTTASQSNHSSGSSSSSGASSALVSAGLSQIDSDNFSGGAAAIARVQSMGDSSGASRLRSALRTRAHRMINNLILRNNPGDCAQAQQIFRTARSANAAPPGDSFGDSCRAP